MSDLVRTRTVHLVHDVFVYNQSMYLTVPSGPGSSGGTPGAIMFIDILGVDWSASEEVELTGRFLFKEDSFDPRGVCTFKNMSGKDPVVGCILLALRGRPFTSLTHRLMVIVLEKVHHHSL